MESESLIPKTNISSIFYALASFSIVIIGLIYFDNILKPLVVAFLIWFVINQLKVKIGKISINGRSLPPLVCNLLAFILIFLLGFLIIEFLIINLEGITASMPEYVANLNEKYSDTSAFFNDPKYAVYLQKWFNGINLSGMAKSLVNSLSGIVAKIAIIIVYLIFILIEEEARNRKVEQLFPEKGKRYLKFNKNLNNINEVIRSYIWSKTIMSFVTGVLSYVVLLIMGVEYTFLWAFIIFVLNFIPYIGPLVSSLLPAIFMVLITGDMLQLVYVFAAMESIQIVLGNFVEPKTMGKGSNLGPVTVIVALAFWGMIWGITGMILAVPVTAVGVIVLSQIPSTRYLAILLSEKGILLK